MAQGLTFTTTGKAVLGPIEPGWSQQEFATPVNPNEKAGGTGVVSFTAEDVAAGVLAINKAAVSTVDGLGSVAGTVRTASKTGQRVTVTHDNKLARYNAIRNMPPMIAASVPGALDLAEQCLGEPGFTGGGIYWSLAGHTVGYNSDGSQAQRSEVARQYFDTSAGSNEAFPYTVKTYRGLVDATQFAVLGGKIYAQNIRGESFFFDRPPVVSPANYNSPIMRVRCKTMLDGGDFTLSFKGGVDWATNAPSYAGGQETSVVINYAAQTLTISGTRQNPALPGERSPFSTTVSIASLNRNAEIAVFFDFGFSNIYSPTGISTNTYQVNARVCNTSNYAAVVEANATYQTPYLDQFYFPWSITGNVRALWTRQDADRSKDTLAEWETARSFSTSSSYALGQPSVGFNGSVWDWLQEACAAYFWEIVLHENVVTGRPVGGTSLEITNVAPSPTLTPTTTRTGRSVNIVWHNAQPVASGLVYEARSDDNRIISVGAAQETVTSIKTNAHLTSIVVPTRTTTFIPGAGTYYVIDSTGLPIVEGQWEDYGGTVLAAIDSAEAGTIVVTLTGPREQIPSTTAPYSLAVSDGENQYAALSILGSGVIADPQTLNLLTGANPALTPQDIAFTVTNSFINTLEQAYDAGIWASVDAAGPRVSLDFSVPTESLTSFGDTAGSLVESFDSTYRVVSASVGRTSTSVEAVRHATVGAFDDAWVAGDVSDHDAAWDGYLCEDQDVFPYLGSPAATLPPPVFPP